MDPQMVWSTGLWILSWSGPLSNGYKDQQELINICTLCETPMKFTDPYKFYKHRVRFHLAFDKKRRGNKIKNICISENLVNIIPDLSTIWCSHLLVKQIHGRSYYPNLTVTMLVFSEAELVKYFVTCFLNFHTSWE